jgi:membrane protease YdiL (CAAX protease family)
MNKLSQDYLLIAFSIMLVCWGICVTCSFYSISLLNCYVLYIPYLLGGLSPTIASYIALKRNNRVCGLKDWLRNVFDIKHNIYSYLMVILLGIAYILPQCFISGCKYGASLYAIIVMIPIMLFGGGLEEAGWRYILQPEMEKSHSFVLSTFIVGIIWWIWHFPLFWIPGTGQCGTNLFAFGISVLGLSFALAVIRKVSNSVWLCVLFHCIINSLSGIYIINENIYGNIASSVALIMLSCLCVVVNKKKELFA